MYKQNKNNEKCFRYAKYPDQLLFKTRLKKED